MAAILISCRCASRRSFFLDHHILQDGLQNLVRIPAEASNNLPLPLLKRLNAHEKSFRHIPKAVRWESGPRSLRHKHKTETVQEGQAQNTRACMQVETCQRRDNTVPGFAARPGPRRSHHAQSHRRTHVNVFTSTQRAEVRRFEVQFMESGQRSKVTHRCVLRTT